MDKPEIAQRLQGAWDSIFESSEDPMFDEALRELREIPTDQRGWIGELIDTIDSFKDDYFHRAFDDGFQEMTLERIEENFSNSARDRGIAIIDGDALFEIDPDASDLYSGKIFETPPPFGREALEEIIQAHRRQAASEPDAAFKRDLESTADDLQRILNELGERADYVIATDFMEGLGDPGEFDVTLEKLGIDPSIWDTIIDSLESHFVGEGDVADWLRSRRRGNP